MTLQPTITASKGAGTVLSSSEWNGDVIQQANYLNELLAGTNTTKIPGSALASTLTLPGSVQVTTTLTAIGASSLQGGLTVVGSTTLAAMSATAGTFTTSLQSNGTLTAVGASSLQGGLAVTGTSALGAVTATSLTTNGALSLSGLTVLVSGAVLANTGSSFSGVPASPAGTFEITVNGSIAAKVPYYV